MNRSMTQKRRNELKENFSLFDKDGDGTISANELGTVMKSVGYQPTEADVAKLIKKADSDGSGVIEFEEFVEMMGDYEVIGEEDIISAFKMFDRNGDGVISRSELKYVIKDLGLTLSEDHIDAMIAMADKDGDGHVSYLEFIAMMMKNQTASQAPPPYSRF